VRVLFLCHGNINRSPAGHIMLQAMEPHWDIRSAALKGKDGVRTTKKMRTALRSRGLDGLGIRSTAVRQDLIDWADVIFYMDNGNERRLREQFGDEVFGKSVRVSDLIGETRIPDPNYSKGTKDHKRVVDQIRSAMRLFRCGLPTHAPPPGDYRLTENRREAFIRWYAWSLQFRDCDPALWMTNYLHERYEHNSEQRLWLSWLYGNTYYLPTSWIIINEFPDFELATHDRLTLWNNANYSRLRYQTDTKWNKGHLPAMYASYAEWVGNGLQHDRFAQFYGETEEETFENLWGQLSGLYKFGRYSTWFFLQHLKHTAGVPVEATSLMLKDYSGSRSHRNGLLWALGRESEVDTKLTAGEYQRLEEEGASILAEVHARFPRLKKDADFFSMETCLCSFKKIWRPKHSRYLGYYLDRQAGEIQRCEGDGWHGIDWDVLWQSRTEQLDYRLTHRTGINPAGYTFLDSGKFARMGWMFKGDTIKADTRDDVFDLFGGE